MALRDQASKLVARRRARRSAHTRTSPLAIQDLRASHREDSPRLVGVLVYQGVTTAEIAEPARALATTLDADVMYIGIGARGTTVVGVEPVRRVYLDASIGDAVSLTADVLVIPGGLGWERLVDDAAVMAWLGQAVAAASGILAISTGSLLLAAAGGLDGKAATGHWLARDALSDMGADVRSDRSVRSVDERVVTASGAMAAVDVAPRLAERVRWGSA